jgi:hypothetical protein
MVPPVQKGGLWEITAALYKDVTPAQRGRTERYKAGAFVTLLPGYTLAQDTWTSIREKILRLGINLAAASL